MNISSQLSAPTLYNHARVVGGELSLERGAEYYLPSVPTKRVSNATPSRDGRDGSRTQLRQDRALFANVQR